MNVTHKNTISGIKRRTLMEERFLSFLYIILLIPILMFAYAINARIGLSAFNQYLDISLIIVFVLLSFRLLLSRLRWWDFLIVLGIGVFCFWSPHVYPQTSLAVLEFGPYFVFSCLPLYLVGASVDLSQSGKLFANIGRLGVIVNGLLCIMALLGLTSQFGDLASENMSFAYNLLPMVILTLWSEFQKHNTLDTILGVIGVLLLFSMGTRGPIMAFSLFVGGYFFIFKKYKNPLFARIFILGLVGFVYLILDDVLSTMMDISSSLGMSTRVYEKLLNHEITDTSSRDWIFDIVVDEIKRDPLGIGQGFFADRQYLLSYDNVQYYAHNIFYEIFLDFGLYIGLGIFLLLFFMMSFSIIINWGKISSTLLFSLFCGYFVIFFFSDSIFKSPTGWFFFGVLSATFRYSLINRKHIKYEK